MITSEWEERGDHLSHENGGAEGKGIWKRLRKESLDGKGAIKKMVVKGKGKGLWRGKKRFTAVYR